MSGQPPNRRDGGCPSGPLGFTAGERRSSGDADRDDESGKRGQQNGLPDLGKGGRSWRLCRRDHARVGRCAAIGVAGGGFAILLKVGLELVARSLRVHLERTQPHVVLVAGRDRPRLLLDRRGQRCNLIGRKPRVVLEHTHILGRRVANLAVEPGELCVQFLHARMQRQQCARSLRDLRLERRSLFDGTAHRLVRDGFGRLVQPSFRLEPAQKFGLGRGGRLN